MAPIINLESFGKRLKKLYQHWSEHKNNLYGGSQAIAVATPPQSNGELRYLKSSALNVWLLGIEFPDTIIVFAKKQIHFLCTQKKASILETVKNPAKNLGLEVLIHVKAKNDDGAALMETILKNLGGDGSVTLGRVVKEVPEGNLLNLWDLKLKSSNLQLVDVTTGLADLFAVKDDSEAANLKRAAYLTTLVMNNFVVPKLEQVIDEEKKVSHSELMEETEKAINQPAKMKVKQLKLNPDNIDICYPPIFQSGGEFDLRPSAVSNGSSLYYDSTSVIICAIGARYNDYCANVARSYLFDAVAEQKKAYSVLLKAHGAAMAALKPGRSVASAYQAALAVVVKDAPELAEKLTKSAGTGIGIEFREPGYILNGKNDKVVKTGMVFNVSLGFQNLQAETKNPKTEKFSLLVSDTVIVSSKGPEVITSASSKAVKDVVYSFQEENDEQEEKQGQAKPASNIESLPSKVTRSVKHEDPTARRQHQAELALQKAEETAMRLAGKESATGTNRSSLKTNTNIVAYKNVKDVPTPEKGMKIQVDPKNDAFLVPIDGVMVPFHVSTVKQVTSHGQQDTRNWYIRIIFNVPGTTFTSVKFQNSIFVKEVTFRSKDHNHVNEIVQQIKTLRRDVAAREAERAERATLVNQENLVLAGNKSRPVRLHELLIRPVFGGKGRKLTGTLEAHVNGFRYSTSRANERVDIMYGNIKHAFVQPAEKEMITLLHFHLHNHIMVGNKKTKDVQLYVEVMDVVQTVGGGRRSAYDPDELEDEQRERDRKNKFNVDFENFVESVHSIWKQQRLDLEFDQPMREYGFFGVPYKSQSFVIPTITCLVELIDNPFLVITLDEIEIVNLERVGLGQKSFDLVVVYKDFKKSVTKIDSIPSSSLEGIEEWMNSTDIKYYESRLNLSWPTILKSITDDPQGFVDGGGWEFLNMEAPSDLDDSDESEDSDQGYEPSDVEMESESEDDDSEIESLVESEQEEEDSDESGEEEEKGKTWEELEREATNADKEKRHETDSEDERRRRKTKAIGKSRAGPSGGATKKPRLR